MNTVKAIKVKKGKKKEKKRWTCCVILTKIISRDGHVTLALQPAVQKKCFTTQTFTQFWLRQNLGQQKSDIFTLNSVQFNFIYTASIPAKAVSRHFSETQSMHMASQTVAKNKSWLETLSGTWLVGGTFLLKTKWAKEYKRRETGQIEWRTKRAVAKIHKYVVQMLKKKHVTRMLVGVLQ